MELTKDLTGHKHTNTTTTTKKKGKQNLVKSSLLLELEYLLLYSMPTTAKEERHKSGEFWKLFHWTFLTHVSKGNDPSIQTGAS